MMSLTVPPAMNASGRRSFFSRLAFFRRSFFRQTWAMLIKEFIQLRRDRVSFTMIVMVPLMQLMLFGYAINTNPRHLPTAVLMQEETDLGRSIIKALENTKYYDVKYVLDNEAEFDRLLASGTVLFAIEIPVNFERAVRRGDKPALLVAADATDPIGSASAMASLGTLVQTALAELMQHRTTLVIAHRLATVLSCDRIIVLDHGKVVEEGTHASLVAANGLYARLARLQFQGI